MTPARPDGGPRPAVHILTLGCPKNEVDSDRMRAVIESSAFHFVDDIDDADIVIVNTCGFIRDAVEESIDTILDLAEWRDAHEGRRLVVAGCLVSRYGADLQEELTEADAFLPVAQEADVLRMLADITGVTPLAAIAAGRTASGPSAYLQISDGCFRHCAYCTIPAIRGEYVSRPLPEIVAEAELLTSLGAKELVLIGQDTSAWGRDLPGPERLADVIRAVASVDAVEWIRLMYVQPDGIDDDLLATMASEPKVCRYLDMPLQHSSAGVLRAMHRSGSSADFLALIERIRSVMPDVVLRTTLIAGYPGETDEDVQSLLEFIENAEFDYVGVFPYSPEEGTVAATLPGLPSQAQRSRRAQLVRDAADAVSVARNAAHLHEMIDVLSEGLDEDGTPVGRWRGQAPEVDGIVLLDREVPEGSIVRARVTDVLGYDLEAQLL